MSSTTKTSKLGLSQFAGSDVPDWIADYSEDMLRIDQKFEEDDNNILTSMEQVAAATDPTMLVGVGAMQEVNSSLNVLESNKLLSHIDISNYNSGTNIYTCPSDGYIMLKNTSGSTDGIANILGATSGGQYFQIGLGTGCHSVFVKKGMRVYITNTCDSAVFVPLS